MPRPESVKIHLGPGMRVGYLSAAPRVSTRDDAETAGPRSHVRGVIHALEELGGVVERFIVGDRMPRMVRVGSERTLSSSRWRTLAADLSRIALGAVNARRAAAELRGKVDWVYERAASLQSLGWALQSADVPWILETSSPVFYEAATERNALVLHNLARRRELWAYHRCDAIVCVSRDLRDILVQAGVAANKIIVVPNGVDTKLFSPDHRRGTRRSFPGFTIGFVGSLIAWQGLEVLIDGVAAARARGLDISVAVAGDGPAREGCEHRARSLGIHEHVVFAGRLRGSEVPQFLAGVDVGYSGQTVMQIGKMYHSPLKLYEYLAMGLPVIASGFDDARSAITDGTTGWLFSPGDRAGLDRAITSAYLARDRLIELGGIARREVVASHSWRARVEIMLRAIAAL